MSESSGLYSGWRREKFGPFAGLSGRQAGAIARCGAESPLTADAHRESTESDASLS